MLSRVANSIYWINRLIERAENYARFIDVNYHLMMDLPPGLEEQWRPLVETTGDQVAFEKKHGEVYSKDNVINFLVFDLDNSNSIISCLTIARENARTVREIISSEMWLQINEMYLNIKHGITKDKLYKKPHRDIAAASGKNGRLLLRHQHAWLRCARYPDRYPHVHCLSQD